MTALGIFERADFTSDQFNRGMKVKMELFVPAEHCAAWQELMADNPRMVRLNAMSELPVKLPKPLPHNENLSGNNPASGSW